MEAAAKGALGGAVVGGIGAAFGGAGAVQQLAAKSAAGGIAGEVQGGNFRDGLYGALVTSGARYAYQALAGTDVTPSSGKNRPGNAPDRQVYDPNPDGTVPDPRVNVMGLNLPFSGSILDPIKQGGAISRALNMIPIGNAVGVLDDAFQNRVNNYFLLPISVPAAIMITVPAALDRVPGYQPQGYQ